MATIWKNMATIVTKGNKVRKLHEKLSGSVLKLFSNENHCFPETETTQDEI